LPLGAFYTDIESFPGVPSLVFAIWQLSFDVHRSLMPGSAQLVNFPFSRDMVAFTTGGSEYFAAYGAGNGGSAQLDIYHVNTQLTFSVPVGTSNLQQLRYNPQTAEVWATVTPTILNGLSYQVIDLANLQVRASLPGNSSALWFTPGLPTLSSNSALYLHPVTDRDVLVVIDAYRYVQRTEIPVVDGPHVVMMQGDTSTREAY
jgi:hypothetical protein